MNIDGFMTAKIRDFFEYTIAGEWGSEGNLETDTPVLRSTNFTNKGKIDYSDIAYRKIDSSCISRRLVNRETILIEKSGGSPSQPAGRVVYCEEDFIGGASNFIEIAKTNNLYCAKYIFFLLHYLYQTGLVLKYQQQTTGIINFKLEQYKDEEVLFASDKKEQEKIAAVLSTIDRAIAQTEAIIAKQQRIKTGLMQDLLTKGIDENGNIRSEDTHEFKDSRLGRIPLNWDVQCLENLVDNIYQGWSPDCESDSVSEDEWGVLKTTAVTWDGYNSQENKKLPTFLNPRPLLEVKKGDVLITRAGPNSRVGVISYVYETLNKKILSDKIYSLKFKENLEPRFFVYSLSGFASQQYLSALKTGMAESQTNISQEIVKKMLTVIPSIQEQISISNLLDQSLQGFKEYLITKNKLYKLKTGLMQDLLTGKVRVTNLLQEKAAAN